MDIFVTVHWSRSVFGGRVCTAVARRSSGRPVFRAKVQGVAGPVGIAFLDEMELVARSTAEENARRLMG